MTAARATHVAKPAAASGPARPVRLGKAHDPAERRADAAAEAMLAPPRPQAPASPFPPLPPSGGSPPLPGGRPIDASTRAYFEPAFGRDLGGVRIHDGPLAAAASAVLGAEAFASGRDIGFARGAYRPSTETGRHLIAHELAHVVDGEQGVVRRSLRSALTSRTVTSAELEPLSLQELEALFAFAEDLARTSLQDDPAFEANFNTLREALLARHAKAAEPEPKPQPKKAPPTPRYGAEGDAAMVLATMAIVDGINQIGSDAYEITYEDKVHIIDEADVAKIRKAASTHLRDAAAAASRIASGARSGYEIQSETDKKHWIVAPIVKWVGDVEDPGPILLAHAGQAAALVASARKAIERGEFVAAAKSLAEAEKRARLADKMYQAYWQQIIESAEFTVTVLEAVRDVSFLTVAVIATVVTAGAALGVGSVGGVALGSAGTATAVATAAPVVASLGEAGMRLAVGDQVDWVGLGVDTALAIVMYRFGGPLAGKIGGKILGTLARETGKTFTKQMAANVVSGVIVGRGATIVRTAVGSVINALNGKDVTWNTFLDQVVASMLDPKAAFMDLVLGAIGGAAQAKASARPPTPSKVPAKAPPASSEAAAPASVEGQPRVRIGTAKPPPSDQVVEPETALRLAEAEADMPASERPAAPARKRQAAMTEPVAAAGTRGGTSSPRRPPAAEPPAVAPGKAAPPKAAPAAEPEPAAAPAQPKPPAQRKGMVQDPDRPNRWRVQPKAGPEEATPAKAPEEPRPTAKAEPETRTRPETGAELEARVLANVPQASKTYFPWKGGQRGTIGSFATALRGYARDFGTKVPRLNRAGVLKGEEGKALSAREFIDGNPNLKAEWAAREQAIHRRLQEKAVARRAAAGDKATIKRLDAEIAQLQKEADGLTAWANGSVQGKRPDLIEVFPGEKRAVVTDITQKPFEPDHNFKTKFYREVVKSLTGWSDVTANEYRSPLTQNPLD